MLVGTLAVLAAACGGPRRSSTVGTARSVLLITIDTLRADRVGAYGLASARTPTMDDVARSGVRFANAYATAPITLPSHASLLSGRYPPNHGSRHNGTAMSASVPTLATAFKQAGFATAAFVSAFPLDKRFGLARGFDVYDDELPRGADGRPLNERAGSETVARARQWLEGQARNRFFLWIHLFEPHAPYGSSTDGRPAMARYDDEIAAADRFAGEAIAALGDRLASTLVIVAADHGEAFGEHREIGHSMFVYDTTLRVPLVMRGAGLPAGTIVGAPVSLVDLAPTVVALTGMSEPFASDGISLVPLIGGDAPPERVMYAESFAPLFDFGWASLRSVREGTWKYIAAPRPELYDLASDPAEASNLEAADPDRAARLLGRVNGFSAAEPQTAPATADREAVSRLRALGYVAGRAPGRPTAKRPDPKDRIQLASRLASVMAGEVQGDELIETLEGILRDDPENPQAHLRLGFAELARGRCDRAEPHFRKALTLALPSADAGLGLAQCLGQSGDLTGAGAALEAANVAEPGNPVVLANLGLLSLERREPARAVEWLRQSLAIDPGLLEARFALARALALDGHRAEAEAEARALLDRLPADAPQRAEVERLIRALAP